MVVPSLSWVFHLTTGSDLIDWLVGLALIVLGFVAALIIRRRPGHRIGTVMAWGAIVGGLNVFADGYRSSGLNDPSDFRLMSVALGSASWYAVFYIMLGLFPLLFPTGRPPTPRWRWVGWLGGAAVTIAIFQAIFQQTICLSSGNNSCVLELANPIGITGVRNADSSGPAGAALVLVLVTAVAAMVSAFVRFSRSSGPERQQLKWMAPLALLWFIDLTLGSLTEDSVPAFWDVFSGLLWLALPIVVGVSILRYRLYEIDRILSRTITYTLVTLVAAAVYAVPVVALPSMVGGSSDLIVAGATLAAAAVFNPARRWIHSRVEHRFNRTRFEAGQVIDDFGARLRANVELDRIPSDLALAVQRTVQPASVTMWIRMVPR